MPKNALCKKQEKPAAITTVEVAEMMEVRHSDILQKLEGTNKTDGTVKTKGIIPVLSERNFPLADYFIESTYIDAQGKPRKCYDCTRLGCDFLANKFTGEKGIIFTAKYVKRFNEMEQVVHSLDINKALAEFKGQIMGLVDEQLGIAIKQVERKCSEYYKPSCADKSSISHYIKKRLGIAKADEEYELVKERVLIRLGARKWEDIDIETLRNSMDIIDESIRILKMERPYEQTSLFEKKGA
ncbi:Rha family transcriptional regulator [Niameybacter massiliensis]|uniref:Rha family transcriptional regulator n=1 Tax=Niameybacter massiliensis TaxID=1658108 RepID=UPI0006B61EF3|nr:Rha family transcriptional regulator [Niameybacter massiliensis]